MIEQAMPHKVLVWASERGTLHNDCLLSSDPCQDCVVLVLQAFHHFYGHITDPQELLLAIVDDYLDDLSKEGES